MADDGPRFPKAEQRLREMQERQAAREASKAAGEPQPRKTVGDVAAGLGGLGLLLILALAALGIVALVVWALVATAGIILKLAGAVLIVVIASLAWREVTKK